VLSTVEELVVAEPVAEVSGADVDELAVVSTTVGPESPFVQAAATRSREVSVAIARARAAMESVSALRSDH